MTNRNQNQARLPVEPAATPTYLNVFTVEEYENNGKAGKKWTKIGAAFPYMDAPTLSRPSLIAQLIGLDCTRTFGL
jgi:hypothetical protein